MFRESIDNSNIKNPHDFSGRGGDLMNICSCLRNSYSRDNVSDVFWSEVLL